MVLGSLALRGVNPLLWEGVATWLGGTLGMSTTQTRRAYASYLRAHAAVTLDSLLSERYDRGFRPAGAVLVQMLFERGGIAAVKTALAAGASDAALRAALQRGLARSWAQVSVDWRERALRP